MAEKIKLKDVEIESLRKIQSKYQEKLLQFGKLTLDKLELDEKIKQLSNLEKKLLEDYELIQKEEQEWVNNIADSYGDGSLSVLDGTFTPN
jgi:hypothetical protein